MRNVTITLDEDTATWARVHAAERDMSLSRFVGEVLRERMRRAREYDDAYRAFLAEKPIRLRKSAEERYLSREEAHDRAGVRRR